MSHSKTRETAFILLIILALVWVFFKDLDEVPFHPDESTFLYTSQDFDTYLSSPLTLAWEPEKSEDALMRYRLLDEPLSRYVFGFARRLAGVPSAAVAVDWDWSAGWEQNAAGGALPGRQALLAARAASSILLLAGALLLYLAARSAGSFPSALAALLLFSLNAIVLLHGRRAMREGVMLFSICLLVWTLPQASNKPWLAGGAAGLAMAARYFALPLVPIGLLAAAWGCITKRAWLAAARKSLVFTGAAVLLFTLLQPVLWRHPLGTVRKMVEARLEFTREGLELMEDLGPQWVLEGCGAKLGALALQTLIASPSFQEFGNYQAALSPSIQAYNRNLLHGLWRGAAGALLLGLFLAGVILFLYRAVRRIGKINAAWYWLGLGLLGQIAFTLLVVRIPFQRYYLPLLPLICLGCGSVFFRPRSQPDEGASQPPPDDAPEDQGAALTAAGR